MSPITTFNIGGVPEHFNLPWHLAMEEGLFEPESLMVNWTDYPGGTGAMAKDLRSGALDIAVLLTEGIVADISKGNSSKIIQSYVASPLIWGIHVPAHSGFQSVAELQGKRFAISRYGSGSHLMAFVHAQQQGWNPKALELVLIGDLQGAREAFRKSEADAFMWERFMTQPLVDAGELRRVGECLTPWPCFVIAARNEVIEQQLPALQRLLSVINRSSKDFMNRLDAEEIVTTRFGIKPGDAAAWYAHTRWATGEPLADAELEKVVQTLVALGVMEKPLEPAALYQAVR
jgi:ABC-type nitrate/sulfonate/bicarbonate transport system substrate-binding protein